MLSAEEFTAQTRDTKTIMEISKSLRNKSMSEKWDYISTSLNIEKASNSPKALVLARKINLDNECLLKILDISLERANPSSMKSYLIAVIYGLGYQKVISYFSRKVESNPEQVGMALYFLPNLPLKTSEIQTKQIIKLHQEFEAYVNKLT